MNGKRSMLAPGVLAGAAAGICSLLALAVRGRVELKSAVAPVNAPSHWLWGDAALRQRKWSWRYTGAGLAVHQASAVMWGLWHARRSSQPPAPLRDAAVTTATAALVYLALTPRRFTPGFEQRLSPRGLAWVYAAFAVGLALGSRAGRPSSAGSGRPMPRGPV